MTIADDYSKLLSLTKLYLLQQYNKKDWKSCSLESLEYFRSFVKEQRQVKNVITPPPKPPMRKQLKTPPPPKESPAEVSRKLERRRSSIETTVSHDFNDLRSIVKKGSPKLTINQKIPEDQEAVNQSQLWKNRASVNDLLILSLNDHPEHHAFLIKVAVAIQNKKRSAEVLTIGELDRIKNPKLILGTKLLFSKHPEIQEKFGKDSKIIEISSISVYLKDVTKKRDLWNLLCKELSI